MNRTELLAKIVSSDNKTAVLGHAVAPLAHLMDCLRPVLDDTGKLVFSISKILDHVDGDNAIHIHGTANAFGQEACNSKLTFSIENGSVSRLVFSLQMSGGWKISDLDKTRDFGGSWFANMGTCDQHLIITSHAGPIFEDVSGWDEVFLEAGMNVFATGFKKPAQISHLGAAKIPVAAQMSALAPNFVAVALDLSAQEPKSHARVWWSTPTADHKLWNTEIQRIGVEVYGDIFSTDPRRQVIFWLWDVKAGDGTEMSFSCEIPHEDGQAPLYALSDTSGVAGRKKADLFHALTGTTMPMIPLPFKDQPTFAVNNLEFCVNKSFLMDMEVINAATNAPYRWEAVPGAVTIENVSVRVSATLSDPQTTDFTIAGQASVAGFVFELDYSSDGKMHGALARPADIDFAKFLDSMIDHGVDFPISGLTILAAEIWMSPEPKTAQHSILVGGHIDLLGNGALVMTEAGFEATTVENETVSTTLIGKVEVAKQQINLQAEKTASSGWIFEGETGPDVEIALDVLCSDFLKQAGLTIPPMMPAITLSDFGMRYGSEHGLFCFWGRAHWTPPQDIQLPWFDGEVDAIVDVNSQLNRATGSRDLGVDVNWTHTTGDQTFQAQASHSHDGQVFSLYWHPTGAKKAYGLNELRNALTLGEGFHLPGTDDWSLFSFTELYLEYHSQPRLIRLQSKAVLGAGHLIFEADFAESTRSMKATWTGNKKTDKIGLPNILETIGMSDKAAAVGKLAEFISFRTASLAYVKGKMTSFQFVGEADNALYKTAFLVLPKDAQGWGFVTGVCFADNVELANVVGFESVYGIDELQSLLSITPVSVLYASRSVDRFAMPADMAVQTTLVGAGHASKQAANADGTYHLNSGLSVSARLIFKTSKNPALARVGDLLDLTEIDGRISIEKPGADAHAPLCVDARALLPKSMGIPTGTGSKLKLSNAYFGVRTAKGVGATLELGGTVSICLFGKLHEVTVALYVDEASADATVQLHDFDLPPFQALPGVHFHKDIAFEIGAQFEPEGLDLGFMGDFYIGQDPLKNPGKVTIVLEMIEAVPNPLYVQFSIKELSLWSMFEAMTGMMERLDEASKIAGQTAAVVPSSSDTHGVAHAPEHAFGFLKQQYQNLGCIFEKFEFHDVAFHWADSIVILPDGSTALPGVGFRGWLDLFGWRTFAAFEISTGVSSKLSAHLEMEPVNLLGIVSIAGDGHGVSVKEVSGETKGWDYWKKASEKKQSLIRQNETPKLLASGKLPPDHAVASDHAMEYVVSPGGPVFIVSSQHAPFMHADIRVALFDLIHTELRADVDETGMSFVLKTGVGDVLNLTLGCKLKTGPVPAVAPAKKPAKTLAKKELFYFEGYGKFGLHLKADLSFDLPLIGHIPIELDAGLDAEMHLIINETINAAGELETDFKMIIDGSFEFEGIELTLPTLTLDAPFASLSDLPEQILSHIDEMAAEIFGELFSSLDKLAEVAVKLVGEAVVAVAKEVEVIAEDAVKAVEAVGEGIASAAEAVGDEVEAAANEISGAAINVATAVAAEAVAIAKGAEKVAEALAEEGRKVFEDAEHAVAQAAIAVGEEVEKIEHEIEDVVNAAVHEAEKIAEEVADEVLAILSTAKEIADEVVHAAEEVAEGIENAAEAVFDEAEKAAEWIEHAAEDAWDAVTPW